VFCPSCAEHLLDREASADGGECRACSSPYPLVPLAATGGGICQACLVVYLALCARVGWTVAQAETEATRLDREMAELEASVARWRAEGRVALADRAIARLVPLAHAQLVADLKVHAARAA
jgi:hypothetical protein